MTRPMDNGQDTDEKQNLKPAQGQDRLDADAKYYRQEKRLEGVKPFEKAEKESGTKINDKTEKINERQDRCSGRSPYYQHEKNLDGRKSVEELENEVRETRDKKAEIVEGMVSRDFPVSNQKNTDNSGDFHYLEEHKFEKELKQRDPRSTEQDVKLTEGFHDGKDNQAFVKDKGGTLDTSLHEKLHQKSLSDMPTRLNEGITEHFSRQEGGTWERIKNIDHRGKEISKPLSDYENEVEIVKKLESTIGREPLERAYFKGETEYLIKSTDGILGEGSYKQIADALESRDYDTAKTIIDNHHKQ